MSPSSAHAGEQHEVGLDQVYQFRTNQFYIWNDELQGFGDRDGPQWQFDYSLLPQMPQHASPQVLKDIANLSDTKSPLSATFNPVQPFICATMPLQVQTAGLDAGNAGLRIDNIDTTPEQAARSRTPVPTIVTEPATHDNTVDETQPLQQSVHGLATLYAEPAQNHCSITPPQACYGPDYISSVSQSASVLQDAFQFHSPVTRRNSVSSCNSGPVFSHYGTPISTYHHEGTPYSLQTNSHGRLGQWSPRSPSATWKPQSRKPSAQSVSRMNQQYITALQKQRGSAGIAMTMPSRRKPRIEHSLSESSLFNNDPSQSGTGTRPTDNRRRASSVAGQRSAGEASTMQSTIQLQLPTFQPDQLFASPVCAHASFPTPDPNMYTLAPHSQLAVSNYMIHEAQQPINLTPSPTVGPYMRPSEPPPTDFQDKPHAQMPIFQAPQFDGDIYTPQYKRRNAKGEWEGWCGLCQPGQWHNLKNSRYWDDKLRNHGICARTKRKFEDPISLRVINLEGDILDLTHELEEIGDMRRDDWVIGGLDGSPRKKEGLCGYCSEWILMDGVRSKGKGKSVGWWSHAYKCHEQGRKAIPAEQVERQPQIQSHFHPQTSEQSHQSQFTNQPMYFSHATNSSYAHC